MEILFLFVMVIGFMLVGVPIAISLGLSSIVFLMMHSDASLASVAQTLFNAFAGHYTLLAIPFFILASSFMSTGGVAKRIIRFPTPAGGRVGTGGKRLCCRRGKLGGRGPRCGRARGPGSSARPA
mgnify:CR=1 FL=1